MQGSSVLRAGYLNAFVHSLFCSPSFSNVYPFFRILKVQPDDKSQPYRDPTTGLCQVAGPNEVGLIVNIVNNKVLQSRFDGYSDESATNKKLLTDVLVKGDCYFNSGDLLSRDEEGFYYWSDRVGDTFRWKGEVHFSLACAMPDFLVLFLAEVPTILASSPSVIDSF